MRDDDPAAGNRPKQLTLSLEAALEHAWGWFTVHANQRMQLVNFWLIAMAFVMGAYIDALHDHRKKVAAFVAIAGALVTVLFQRLDTRTRALVLAAEKALCALQQSLVASTGVPELSLVAKTQPKFAVITSYRWIILWIHTVGFAGFAAAAVYAWRK